MLTGWEGLECTKMSKNHENYKGKGKEIIAGENKEKEKGGKRKKKRMKKK